MPERALQQQSMAARAGPRQWQATWIGTYPMSSHKMRQKANAADAASTTMLQWNPTPCLSGMVCTIDLTKHSSISLRDSGRRRSAASGACQAEATVTTIRVRRLVRKAGAMIVRPAASASALAECTQAPSLPLS